MDNFPYYTKDSDLSIEKIRNSISENIIIGKEILYFQSITSTNTVALELASNNCNEGTVIIADMQTDGKGRLGRKWISPIGKNLYMSIILKPEIPLKDVQILTLFSAVSCASAIRKLHKIHVLIKWPNDLMVNNKKLGGILTEIKNEPGRISFAVIGIGLNINLERKDLPEDIREKATSLKEELGSNVSRTDTLIAILKELERIYNLLLRLGKTFIIEEYLKMSSTIGRDVKVIMNDTNIIGTAIDIDTNGMLIVKLADNSLKKISYGDIVHIR